MSKYILSWQTRFFYAAQICNNIFVFVWVRCKLFGLSRSQFIVWCFCRGDNGKSGNVNYFSQSRVKLNECNSRQKRVLTAINFFVALKKVSAPFFFLLRKGNVCPGKIGLFHLLNNPTRTRHYCFKFCHKKYKGIFF